MAAGFPILINRIQWGNGTIIAGVGILPRDFNTIGLVIQSVGQGVQHHFDVLVVKLGNGGIIQKPDIKSEAGRRHE